MSPSSPRSGRVVAGYGFALAAGALWGTTGPLSTALYAEGAVLTDVSFWRVFLSALGFLAYGLVRRDLFHMDRRGLLVVMLGGGLLVALFELAYPYAIVGVGVAGAATLLYTAPVLVALFAHLLLRECLTPVRLLLALVVMVGVALTVTGSAHAGAGSLADGRALGIAAGLLSAAGFAGSTLLARWAVPRYGAVRVLFYQVAGGALLLSVVLPLGGRTPTPATTLAGWTFIAALGIGTVLAANFCFFAALRRIEAAPTAVAASIEPVVGSLLALVLFNQQLTPLGWAGLLLVVSGVAAGYLREADAPRSAPVARTELAS